LVDTEAGDRVSPVTWVGGVERLEVVGDESMRRATSREERVWLMVRSRWCSQRGESAGDTAARAGFTGGMKLQAAAMADLRSGREGEGGQR